jgi:anti-anti-sigma factor
MATSPCPPASPTLDLAVVHDRNGPRVVVHGELDLASAPRLLACVRDELRGTRVTLDLSGVTFLDSSGLHVLAQLTCRDGARIVSSSERVRRIAELTGLTDVLDG